MSWNGAYGRLQLQRLGPRGQGRLDWRPRWYYFLSLWRIRPWPWTDGGSRSGSYRWPWSSLRWPWSSLGWTGIRSGGVWQRPNRSSGWPWSWTPWRPWIGSPGWSWVWPWSWSGLGSWPWSPSWRTPWVVPCLRFYEIPFLFSGTLSFPLPEPFPFLLFMISLHIPTSYIPIPRCLSFSASTSQISLLIRLGSKLAIFSLSRLSSWVIMSIPGFHPHVGTSHEVRPMCCLLVKLFWVHVCFGWWYPWLENSCRYMSLWGRDALGGRNVGLCGLSCCLGSLHLLVDVVQGVLLLGFASLARWLPFGSTSGLRCLTWSSINCWFYKIQQKWLKYNILWIPLWHLYYKQ